MARLSDFYRLASVSCSWTACQAGGRLLPFLRTSHQEAPRSCARWAHSDTLSLLQLWHCLAPSPTSLSLSMCNLGSLFGYWCSRPDRVPSLLRRGESMLHLLISLLLSRVSTLSKCYCRGRPMPRFLCISVLAVSIEVGPGCCYCYLVRTNELVLPLP